MQKIFFTDLDGTLLNDKKQISSQNRQAIQKLTASGHKIVLTTGRSLPSAIHQANLLHLTFDGCYLIAFNGAEIYDSYHKKTLYKNRIPIDAVNRIFSLCEKNHIHVHTYDDQYVITRYVTKELKRYCNEMVCDYKLMSDVTETLGEGPSKLLLLDYDNHMSLENMKKEILRTESNIVDSFFSGDGLLEVVLKGTSKGNGLKKLCKILDISLENSVAVGDGMNDISMLKAAHVGVAMKNAPEDVRASADYITEHDNNESGVAEIIHKFILNA